MTATVNRQASLFDQPVAAPQSADPAPVAVAPPDIAAEARQTFDALVRRTVQEGGRARYHDLLRWSVVWLATHGRVARTKACDPDDLADVWRMLAWVRRGLWTVTIDADGRGATFTSSGGRTHHVVFTTVVDARMASPRRARRTDPETSKRAATSITKLTDRRHAVLHTLRAIGSGTDEQIAAAYPDDAMPQSPSGLRTRRSELVEAGLVVDTGKRATLASGRQGIVWAPR